MYFIFRFAVAARDTNLAKKAENGPGPGQYDPVLMETKLSFSLRSRPVEKNDKQRAPGPGKYSPNTSLVMETVPSAAIAKSPKIFETELEKVTKHVPGPGTYSNSTTLAGPKWGFGSSDRKPEIVKEVPGPGSYDII